MIAAVSITPLGLGEAVGAEVAEAIAVLRQSGLAVETNAMFTNIEGEWGPVMDAIREAVEVVARKAPRVSVVIKIDHRPGVDDAINSKVRSVESYLAGHRPDREAG